LHDFVISLSELTFVCRAMRSLQNDLF